ncbi:MAG: hypothetical protein AB1757_16160 [Acidobacteriota bacterium]
MLKRSILLVFFLFFGMMSVSKIFSAAPIQDLSAFKNNSCVNCHSRAEGSALEGSRYYEWHMSVHKIEGIGCDKCHGGNATSNDKKLAHMGVLSPKAGDSKLHPKNLPATCGACHQPIMTAFVNSKHAQQLKGANVGPSCNTCHQHMGSEIIYSVEDIATVCSSCHDANKGVMPRNPEISKKSVETLNALRRANGVVVWAEGLIKDAQNKKVNVSAEEVKVKNVREMLKDAKASWHTFTLDDTRKKADAVFEAGTRVKDVLRNRLYPQ